MTRVVEARHYLTGLKHSLELQPGTEYHAGPLEWRLAAWNPAHNANSNSASCWIAPALVDVQINGYGGVDLQSDSIDLSRLLKLCAALHRDGCGFFFPTLITDEWPRMMRRLAFLKRLREEHPFTRGMIGGWHLEGPFLSDRPGFHGAHNPRFMQDPTPAHIEAVKAITGNDPVLITLAPERPGAVEFTRLAVSEGFIVCLGHTDASIEQLRECVQAGATAVTHLGNAVPQNLHRHDNVLWRILDTEGLSASLIPDGVHLPDPVLRSIWRIKGSDRLFFTTDAMAGAGAPPGRHRIGHLEVEVGSDRIVREPGSSNFAGSALEPAKGVQLAAEALKLPWQETWRAFSEAPLRILNKSPARTAKPLANPRCCLIPLAQPFTPSGIETILMEASTSPF